MEKQEKKKKRKILLIIVPLIILLIILYFCFFRIKSQTKETPDIEVSGIQVTISKDDTSNKQTRKTRILGDNNNNLNQTNPYLYLQNDASNSVYLQFDIVEGENTIYSSSLIEPGMMERFDAFSVLSKGNHKLEYHITSYKLETKEICLSGVKQIKEINIS